MGHDLRPSTQVRAALSAEGGVLLHVGTGKLFKLNAFGACIWERFANGESVAGIIHEIVQATHAAETVVAADVDRLVGQLLSTGLLKEIARE